MLTRVVEILQQQNSECIPALEKELAQLTCEQQRCRQEGKHMLQAIGGDKARRRDMTTERIAELDEGASQLELRIAELRDELAAVQRETVSAAAIQRAVALFDPVWDMLLVPERFVIQHLLLESEVYDGATSELELAFYPRASPARRRRSSTGAATRTALPRATGSGSSGRGSYRSRPRRGTRGPPWAKT